LNTIKRPVQQVFPRVQARQGFHTSPRAPSLDAAKITSSTSASSADAQSHDKKTQDPDNKRPTLNERDEEHLRRMKEAMGGADMANTEFEDGVPDRGMKRNVRENMFRII
jgi:hypothetical protein